MWLMSSFWKLNLFALVGDYVSPKDDLGIPLLNRSGEVADSCELEKHFKHEQRYRPKNHIRAFVFLSRPDFCMFHSTNTLSLTTKTSSIKLTHSVLNIDVTVG